MEEIKYVKYANKIDQLKEDFDNIIDRVDNEKCYSLMSEYKNDIAKIKDKDKLEIAFIGQYSAGKSTLISSLTENMNIKTGQNITTDKVNEYKWNNIVLIDTPGIGTDYQEHSDLAYRYMDLADLLVYVVTTQGFDELIAKDFKNIAFTQQKSSKMMLVVNKTSLESLANKSYWEEDIRKVLTPYTLEEFRVTFTDANSYLEALKPKNEKFRSPLIERSNLNNLILNLNDFSEDKGIVGRLLSPLNVLNTYIDKVITETSTNEKEKKVQELLIRKKFLVVESRKNINREIENEIQNLYNSVMIVSDEFLSKITGEKNSSELNYNFQTTKEKVETLCSEVGERIADIVDQELDDLIKKINALEDTPVFKELIKEFNMDVDFHVNFKDKKDANHFKKAPESIRDIGKFLGVAGKGFKSWCINAEKAGNGLRKLSGSEAHKFVLDVGHFFGKKFRPYEALKIVNKFGKAGEVLTKVGTKVSVVTAVASPLMAAYDEYQEGANEKRLLEARNEVRNNFRTWANEIKRNAQEKRADLLNSVHDKELDTINSRIHSLRDKEKLQTKQSKLLLELQQEVERTSRDIEGNM
ncbi:MULTISPECIES: GTPase [Bacillus]|uniref:GTPase n=2 Tax=Bacillaceae TaxID=186817 RepID=UPI002040DEC2|nr:GTPase [Bacillus altitudinis]MCM3046883.1 50S ribosome-binding GTPase [Bacillus altitudinis]MEC1804855.1 50S ribosome-binding GTPase [Bacillus altitudinis]UUH74498.1 50S ribosome-binding GTPase [Bacillus altitudinis]